MHERLTITVINLIQ